MASEAVFNGSALPAMPTFGQPTLSSLKPARSAPDFNRRHSLPLNLLPPGLWNSNASSASLVESEEAARGESSIDEGNVANRILALRQLNGATRSRHQYAKSTGARNSTFSQPVIVRTYSGPSRPRSQQRDIVTVKKENGLSAMGAGKMELKLPPVEAFSFKGIMDEIKYGVADDLERIAEICARSKYSLSNQYEVHMPPHGPGDTFIQTIGLGVVPQAHTPAGRTLQEHPSDDEQTRRPARGSKASRRAGVAAHSTLETIMSSSRSSEEDKSKKKPAAVLAEEVRGRAAKHELEGQPSINDVANEALEPGPVEERPTKHTRSKSASFASMIIDSTHNANHDTASHLVSPTSLVSEPARPLTSIALGAGVEIGKAVDGADLDTPPKPPAASNELSSSRMRSENDIKYSILGSLNSWLPWNNKPSGNTGSVIGRARGASNAEGSLRDLLKSAEYDRKGKAVDRHS